MFGILDHQTRCIFKLVHFIKNYSHNLVLYQFPAKKFIITITSDLFHCKPVLIGFLLSQNWSSKLLRVLPSGINPRILFGYCFFNKFLSLNQLSTGLIQIIERRTLFCKVHKTQIYVTILNHQCGCLTCIGIRTR